MTSEIRYWCPAWFPTAPGEPPCGSFFQAGSYIDFVGPDGETVEYPDFEPHHAECIAHDTVPDEVDPAEYDRRLQAAHQLAVARAYAPVKPEPWVDPELRDGGEIGDGGDCFGHDDYRSCTFGVLELELDTPAGPRRKLMCRKMRKEPNLTWRRQYLERGHTHQCLDYLPPNY